MSTTKEEIAQWMIDQFKERRTITQESMVRLIIRTFGREWSYKNKNGNLAIHKDVLAEFRKLNDGSIVWDRAYRHWQVKKPKNDPAKDA